ncbi:hypothetical protein ACTG9Q_24735 [Actinokineospora sp. 24-640]
MSITSQVANELGWTVAAVWVSVGGVVVAVAAIVVAAWVTRRYSRKRRHLFYNVTAVPIVRPVNPAFQGEVEVIVRRPGSDEALNDPHVVTLFIVSRSDDDITPGCFQGPLIFDFNVPVIALMESNSEPGRKGVSPPGVETTASALHVRPSLITTTHKLWYSLLVEGQPALSIDGSPANVVIDDSRNSRVGGRLAWPLLATACMLSFSVDLFIAFGGSRVGVPWFKLTLLPTAMLVTVVLVIYAYRLRGAQKERE